LTKTRFQFYPANKKIPEHLESLIGAFEKNWEKISSQNHTMNSNSVLEILRSDLESAEFLIEKGKKFNEKIKIPVLFGENGKIIKSFDVDGFHEETGTVLEVEAGRAVDNNQFLKDFFESCIMKNVNYCVIGVRDVYRKQKDFEKVKDFFDSMYASGRLGIPLKGLLIVGY
jgi:hypothetical protein